MPSNYIILCHPLLLLPSIFLSIRVFLNDSALPIRRSKYWRFSFSISPSNEYSGLISLRTDWFDILVVQGTLVFSTTTIWKHQLFDPQPSLWSNSHIHTWLLKKTQVKITQSCPTLCDPLDCNPAGSSRSVGFSRQEYWSELPLLSSMDLPDLGIESRSPAWQADS